MPHDLSRRSLLGAALALGTAGPIPARAATPPIRLVAARRSLEVNGKPATVFGLTGPTGASGLVLDPGQRFAVTLDNQTAEDTVIHWHGQTPPNPQDGVVETGSRLIPAGATQDYDFAARGGTHWMHSHRGLQEQRLLAAPLIVRNAEDARLDAEEVVVLLHDFSFQDPAAMLAGLTGGMAGMGEAAGHPHGGHAMPGMGGMPGPTGSTGGGHAMPGASADMAPGASAGMPRPATGRMHGAAAGMDLNDVDYDAYLANDRTLDDPQVVRTERNGRVRLRLINGATSTAFWIDLGAARARVLAVDGNPVRPVEGSRFPLAQGQRIDLLVTLPAGSGALPVLARREGDRARTGLILAPPGTAIARIGGQATDAAPPVDLSLEQRLVAATPLPARPVAVTHRVTLSGTMAPYDWRIDGRVWADHRPLPVRAGQRVALQFVNQSAMAHPMHLHGHHFQVLGLGAARHAGAVRDTVLVPAGGSVLVAFDADNPGRWLLHCHNLFHMATGMMTEIAYDPGPQHA